MKTMDQIDELVDWQMKSGPNRSHDAMCYRYLMQDCNDIGFALSSIDIGVPYPIVDCMVWDAHDGGAPINTQDRIDPQTMIWDD